MTEGQRGAVTMAVPVMAGNVPARARLAGGVLERRDPGSTAVLVAMMLTLVSLPLEGAWLTAVSPPRWRWVMTDVEALAGITIVGWLLLLTARRRWPRVPRTVAIPLGLLASVTWLAAWQAGPNQQLGWVIATRASLAWGLFLVALDLVRSPRAALALIGVVVAGGVLSALTGWVAAVNGSTAGLFGAGRLFTVGGVDRMAGTWDYPTIAAMAWETMLLLVLPLLAWRAVSPGVRRWLPLCFGVPVVVILGSAVLLTLTRGAFLGLAAGLAVLLVGAALLRSRALAGVGIVAAAGLTVGAAALYVALPLPVERLLHESDGDLYGADYTVAGRLAAVPASRLAVEVGIRNTGLATWRPDGPHPWVLAAVWLDPRTHAVLTEHQLAGVLAGPVAPGDRVALQALVDVPGLPRELELAWDMQQVGVADFSERDVPVAITRVTVDPDAETRPMPPSEAGTLLLYPTKLPILDRSELWTAALRLVEKHPLLGVGPGAYRRVYGAELGLTRWDTQIHANDLYLELAATTGLLGLGAFLATVGLGLARGLRGVRAARDGGPQVTLAAMIAVGCLAATGAALGHGIVDHFLVFMALAILFWVPLGIAAALAGALLPPPRMAAGTAERAR